MCEQDIIIKSHSRKVNNLETILAISEETVKKLVEKFQVAVVKKLKCEYCEFETTSSQGLKVHMKRKHTLKGTEIYPRKCDVCDVELESKKGMKEHMKLHSYKKANYQCIDCEFLGDNQRSMDVHIGKHHSENVECGLCELELKTIDDLELHLVTNYM